MNRTAVVLALMLPLLGGCDGAVEAPSEEVVRPVKIYTFGGPGDALVVEYAGTVAAAQRSDMGFEVPGRVVEFRVTAGDRVSEGQVLARLDPADYQAQLDKAIADRNAAEADFRRFEQAYRENAVTRQDLDLASRNLEVANAALRSARKAVADTKLQAPFDGVVARKLVNDFANVQAKQAVLVLQDESSLEMEVDIPEQDWARAKPGIETEGRAQRLHPRVMISAIQGREFPAYLKELNTTAAPVTRTYQVTLGFDNPDDVNVRPGMTGRVVLTVPPELDLGTTSGGAVIPAVAVRTDETGEAFVWRLDEDMRVHRQPVAVGEITGERIRLLEGLEAGDRIAVSGVHNLREGMQVRAYEP
jgi:RND family efflux transporter MFP subunit